MTYRLALPALILTAALAACVETTPPPRPLPPVATTCDGEAFRYLIGQNISVLAAMGLQGPVRVIGPNTAVTMDFRSDRLNIVHDVRGTIVDVGCY